MKNSNKTLIVTILVILLIITGLVISSRIMINKAGSGHKKYSNDNMISKKYNFSDFDAIRAEGAWRIDIVRNDNYTVTVEFPEELIDEISVSAWDNELILTNDISRDRQHEYFRATIGMPALTSIDTEDGVSMEFADFNCDNLKITITGAAEIRGNNSTINTLDVQCDGATHVNMRNSAIENANIDINGASRIVLNMTGGKLRGSAHGASSIVYYGDVSTQDIETAGAVSIRHR